MFNKQAGGNQLLNPQEILEKVIGLEYGSKVASFGCGPKAYFTFQAARIVGEKGLVYAIDVLKDVLSSVDSHAKLNDFNNVKTVWSNLETYGATKIPESSLDLGMLINILYQSTNVASMIKECVRLLKKDAKLLIVDWQGTGSPLGPRSDRRVNPEDIKNLADACNLKFEQEFQAGQFHFGLIFTKK